MTVVQNFYANCNIFITGGTGYVGSVLIEKLLRSCPNVANIYLLIREKDGFTPQQRLDTLLDDIIYENIRSKCPDITKKCHVIRGDIQYDGLALDEADHDLLINKIDIVFHCAATIQYHAPLRTAVTLNVRGVREVLVLCEEMKYLKSVIHLSSAYSNCSRSVIEEQFYDPPLSPETIISLVDDASDETLEEINPSLLKSHEYTWPNNYTFTKAISEELIRRKTNVLPVAIVRPSNILTAYNEPLPGYTNNPFNAIRHAVLMGLGVIKVLWCDRRIKQNFIPVDYAVNACIVAAERVSTEFKQETHTPKMIYNLTINNEQALSIGEIYQIGKQNIKQFPFRQAVYAVSILSTKHFFFFFPLFVLLNFMPALLADTINSFRGKKTKYFAYAKQIYEYLIQMSNFQLNDWEMPHPNLGELWTTMNEKDQKIFQFDIDSLDAHDFFTYSAYGIKKYLLKEKMDKASIATDKEKHKRLEKVHFYVFNIFRVLFMLSVIFMHYLIFDLHYDHTQHNCIFYLCLCTVASFLYDIITK